MIDLPLSAQYPMVSAFRLLASPSPPRAQDAPVDRSVRLRLLVNDNYDAVWRTLRRFGVAHASVDDATQQVFMVAARRIDEIVPDGERRYLLGIAVRVASELRRAQGRRREQPPAEETEWEDSAPSAEDLVDQKRARELMDRILGSLAIELRTVFVLYELEGMSLPEIATAEGIPLGTATSRLRRAREQFRDATELLLSKGVQGGAP